MCCSQSQYSVKLELLYTRCKTVHVQVQLMVPTRKPEIIMQVRAASVYIILPLNIKN